MRSKVSRANGKATEVANEQNIARPRVGFDGRLALFVYAGAFVRFLARTLRFAARFAIAMR